MARGARRLLAPGRVRSLLLSLLCAPLAGCDGGELVNLGATRGQQWAGDGGSASAGAGDTGGSIQHAWQPEAAPVLEEPGYLLANATLTRGMDRIYFTRQKRYYAETAELYFAERAGSGFGAPMQVELGGSPASDAASPAVSLDGDELWFGAPSLDGPGATDVWHSRLERGAWTAPELLPDLSSSADDAPRPATGAGTLMPLSSNRHAEGPLFQLYLFGRDSPSEPWGELPSSLLSNLNSASYESSDGFLTEDGLTIYFASTRPGSSGSDLYQARRATLDDAFGEPELLADLQTPSHERDPWVSPDGAWLYYSSNRSGLYAIYRAARLR